MSFVQAKCTNCGGILSVEDNLEAAVCPFCNTPYIVEKAVNNYNITNNVNVGAGAVVNVIGEKDDGFKIVAGKLISYNGVSTDVVIPDTVNVIGIEAFKGLTGLKRITIPNSVTSIGESAFAFCTGLTSITIPNSVNKIGSRVFESCTGLTSITIPNSVTEIPGMTFHECTGLTSIIIPDSVTYIGVFAFEGCTGLTSITIPDSVTKIEFRAFNGCTCLTNINASKEIRNMMKSSKKACYVATAVYGSYDCPQVWTLRRYRDYQLASTWYGRAFIHIYYAISPTIVKWFGDTQWFKDMWKGKLDKMVGSLQLKGYESTPYDDLDW